MNSVQVIMDYFSTYGIVFLFIIVFLEYLNLPGLPAGIIMPAAGILISNSQLSFVYALTVSVIAGMLGSFVLYGIGYYLGKPCINKIYNKYSKTQKAIDKTFRYIDKYGNKGIFISRLLPVARTLISIVAGVFNVNIFKFSIYSFFGIIIWNFVFIYAGYAFGYLFF